jgi:hypothetical protein
MRLSAPSYSASFSPLPIYQQMVDISRFCTGQDEGEMAFFTAKTQRYKEAECIICAKISD